MAAEQKVEVKELRVKELPITTHQKIEKYIAIELAEHDRSITKQVATCELLAEATKHIKLPKK